MVIVVPKGLYTRDTFKNVLCQTYAEPLGLETETTGN